MFGPIFHDTRYGRLQSVWVKAKLDLICVRERQRVCSSANSRERWKSVNRGNETDSSSLSNVHQQETHGHPAYANIFSANRPDRAFTWLFIMYKDGCFRLFTNFSELKILLMLIYSLPTSLIRLSHTFWSINTAGKSWQDCQVIIFVFVCSQFGGLSFVAPLQSHILLFGELHCSYMLHCLLLESRRRGEGNPRLYREVYIHIYTGIQKYTQVCRSIHKYTEVCKSIHKYTEVYKCTQLSDPGQAHGQTISTLLLMLAYLTFVIFFPHKQLCVQNLICVTVWQSSFFEWTA